MPQQQSYLFDLDGTLTDNSAGIFQCLRYALEKLGRALPPGEDLRWCIGPPIRWTLGRLLGTEEPALVERAVELYRERYGAEGMFENAVYPGIPELLEALRAAGAGLYVATSKPGFYARPILAHFGLDRYFRVIRGAELDGSRSEKVELIEAVIEASRNGGGDAIERARATMIGDRRYDILGAKRTGLRAIGVTWGYGTREELREAGADRLIDSPMDLLR